MEIIIRKDAKALGLSKYFTGKPCKHGHVEERRTDNGNCKECELSTVHRYIDRNLEKVTISRKIADKKRGAYFAYYESKKRVVKLQRTPIWSDLTKIRCIYLEREKISKETGIPHAVDHVIPLQGKNVSGLHVPENLQIITRSANSKKYNKFNLEEYNAQTSK